MVNQTSISLLQQLVSQTQANLTAYQEVLDALNTQLTTDQTAIDKAVSDKVASVLTPVQTAIDSAKSVLVAPAEQIIN